MYLSTLNFSTLSQNATLHHYKYKKACFNGPFTSLVLRELGMRAPSHDLNSKRNDTTGHNRTSLIRKVKSSNFGIKRSRKRNILITEIKAML